MKRSHVNAVIEEADALIRAHGFALPPFAHWSPDEMLERHAAGEIDGIVDARLGWDVTDYGRGEFGRMGLVLFTARNGTPDGGGVPYAEKIMISRRNQVSPMHRHGRKTEDIINRASGNEETTLAIRMFGSDREGRLDRTAPVTVQTDGVRRELEPGAVLRLAPGESVTLEPGNWHEFWGEGGDVLVGEVSTVNDDETDNVFAEPLGRFSTIGEDEPPFRLLVSDYAAWLGAS